MIIATSLSTSYPLNTLSNNTELIAKAFKAGNASQLGKHLNPTVELEILDDENIYSKAQAELMLKDFFNRNKPIDFKINHQGSKGSTSFAIGILETATGNYRVSFFLKTEKSNMFIHQLRIKPSNEDAE